MRKLVYVALFGFLFNACSKEEKVEVEEYDSSCSTTMNLFVKGDQKDNLFIQGDQGLKSSALTYTSYVSPGDTMIWQLAENSNMKSIEDIILVSSDCGPMLEGDLIFNEDKSRCFGIVASSFIGHAKYDIKYKFKDGSIVIVDPDTDGKPPIK